MRRGMIFVCLFVLLISVSFVSAGIVADVRTGIGDFVLKNFGKTVETTGKSIVITWDDFENRKSGTDVYVQTGDGKEHKIIFKDGRQPQIISGQDISVKGKTFGDISKAGTEISVFSSGDFAVNEVSGGGLRSLQEDNLGEQRTAFIMVRLTDTQDTSALDGSVINSLFFSEDGVNNFYLENSNGSVWFTVDVFGYYNVPFSREGCPYQEVFYYLRTNPPQAGPQINWSNYRRVVYAWPEYAEDCVVGGRGLVGSYIFETYSGNARFSYVFLNGQWGLTKKVVIHELGHNFGARHANFLDCGDNSVGGGTFGIDGCSTLEYGDQFDIMGSGMHFNSIHKELFGWFDSSNILEVVGSENDFGIYTLNPLEGNNFNESLKIYDGFHTNQYYVDYRRPQGFDEQIIDSERTGVYIQTNLFIPSEQFGGGDTQLIDVSPLDDSLNLKKGETFHDEFSGTLISVLNITPEEATVMVLPRGCVGLNNLELPEICDGYDNDCDSEIDEGGVCCTTEICDGIDNNCDGQIDEGACCSWEYDMDLDGFSPGLGCEPWDCDDENPDIYPGALEICDGVDNNCDGVIDEGCDCLSGTTRDCGTDVGECNSGNQTCESGQWGYCFGEIKSVGEQCDSKDNDCDTAIDEGAVCSGGEVCDLKAELNGAICPAGHLCSSTYCANTVPLLNPNETESSFATGNLACESIGQTCAMIRWKTSQNWYPSDADCNYNFTGGRPLESAHGDAVCLTCNYSAICETSCPSPRTEVCDAIDNDCDGMVDENNPCASPDTFHCILGSCVAASCQGNCQTAGYECGVHNFCGASQNCGTCSGTEVCQDGQCVAPQQPTCFDSDDDGTNNGLNKFVKGYALIGSDIETLVEDTCSSGFINTVEEKYCSTETMIGMLTQYCGEGFVCEDGKCVSGGDECIAGQIQCIGQPGPDYYKKCMDCDSDGANEWCYRPNAGGESFRCGYENGIYVDDEVCQNGQCISFGESCAGFGFECGTQSLCGANINCGTCDSGKTCQNGECVPSGGDSCQSLGIECGVHNINGNTKDCGGCDDCNECTFDMCNYVRDGEATCGHTPKYEGTPCTSCNGDNCVCSAGQCLDADNCVNECNLGENTCSDSRNLKVCGNYDYDSCYEYNWGGIGAGNVLCPFGEECSNGACVPCLKTCASEGFDCGTHNFCNQYVNCGTCGAEGTACSSGNCVDCTNWDCNTKGFTCGTHNICGESFDCGTCGEGMNCGRTEFCLTAGTGACVCVNSNNGGISCKKGETVQIVGGQERCVPLPTPAPTPTPIPEELEDEAIGLSPQVNYEGPLMKLWKWFAEKWREAD